MQIQQLTYFVAIAEQGSINKAAEKLFVTQPNLSKAIRIWKTSSRCASSTARTRASR